MTSLPKDNLVKKDLAPAGEFSIIHDIFSPLAKDAPGAFGLLDDAASLTPSKGQDLVITKDTLVGGVHFLATDPPDLIGKKCLRVNLSDLAAKGATPIGYLLSCAWPAHISMDFIRSFARGLAEDQSEFGVSLLGGDTVATPGPLTISVTAIGEVPRGQMLKRGGAKVSDDVYLSGTIGDAFLGLEVLQGKLYMETADLAAALVRRYHVPQPRVACGQALLGLAHGSIDVSDGLFADARHLAQVSGVCIRLDLHRVPKSAAARASGVDILKLASEGDDYEILFTAGPDQSEAISRLSDDLNVGIHCIGQVEDGEGVRAVNEAGQDQEIFKYGYEH